MGHVTWFGDQHLEQPVIRHSWNDNQCIKDTNPYCMEPQPVSSHHVSLPFPPQLPWQGTHCISGRSTPSDWGGGQLMMQWREHLSQWVARRKDNWIVWLLNTPNTATDCWQFTQLKLSHSHFHSPHPTKTPHPVRVSSGCVAHSVPSANSEGTGCPMPAPKRSTSDRPQGNPTKGQKEILELVGKEKLRELQYAVNIYTVHMKEWRPMVQYLSLCMTLIRMCLQWGTV